MRGKTLQVNNMSNINSKKLNIKEVSHERADHIAKEEKYYIANDPIINRRVLFFVNGNEIISMITGYRIKLKK